MNLARRHLLRCAPAVSLAVATGFAGRLAQAAAATPSRAIAFAGNVMSPATFTVQDFGQLASQTLEFRAPDGSVRKYVGTLLRDALSSVKPSEPDHDALRQSYAVVKGTDGYFALFTWAELFISPIGEGALIVYLRDGKPLGDDEGAFALISTKDTRPGPRYVKWLATVDFRRASP